MKIEIKTRNVQNETVVRDYIEKKVHFALDRVEDRIESVTVRLEDETRDSKRFDGNCRIDVHLVPRRHIHVSANGESTYDCVLEAIRKMEHAVKHDIDKNRTSASVRRQKARQPVLEPAPE